MSDWYDPGVSQKEFLALAKRFERLERGGLQELLCDTQHALKKAADDVYHLTGIGEEFYQSLRTIYKILSSDKIRKIHTGPCDWDSEDSDLLCELCLARSEACVTSRT